MKKVKIIFASMLLAFTGYSQYEEYIPYIEPYLSAPIESGFFHFITPNNIQAGQLYQWYKITAPDPDNDMVLVKVHTDSVMGMTHYKYQQLYKGLRVEVAGCIEHYQSDGSLNMINAKIADKIDQSEIPRISGDEAINIVLNLVNRENDVRFAWEDDEWEEHLKVEMDDENATWYPTAELMWAIDSVSNVGLIIDGSRYRLAYKITIATIDPTHGLLTYFIDANTEDVLKYRDTRNNDGPADIYGYGIQTVDTKWWGGFTYSWVLNANNNSRDILTYKHNGGNAISFTNGNKVTSNNDTWIGLSSETSPHFFTTQAWDYFYENYGRAGYNWNGIQCKILTQVNSPIGSYYQRATFKANGDLNTYPYIVLHKRLISSTPYDEGWDPTITIHEYTHGLTQFTASLENEFESGALNESFSDIFGITIRAIKLDNGFTDWIYGNGIPRPVELTRRLDLPKLAGQNWTGQFINGAPVYSIGQPDTYLGENYCTNCPYIVDRGGTHINAGIQNKWFYLLVNGGTGINDNGDPYDIQGIGFNKAAQIAYYNLTGVLLEGAQFSDSRQGSIWEAKNLFGECSIEYQSTVNAWYAVGIGGQHNCSYTLGNPTQNQSLEVSIYPNPSSSSITIQTSVSVSTPIQIIDISGKLIDEFESNGLIFSRNITNLSNGIYFLVVINNDSVQTLRFVVNK